MGTFGLATDHGICCASTREVEIEKSAAGGSWGWCAPARRGHVKAVWSWPTQTRQDHSSQGLWVACSGAPELGPDGSAQTTRAGFGKLRGVEWGEVLSKGPVRRSLQAGTRLTRRAARGSLRDLLPRGCGLGPELSQTSLSQILARAAPGHGPKGTKGLGTWAWH